MKFEDIIILSACVVGLFGGIILFFLDASPVIIAWFIALGSAALVYRFLGGIPENSSVTSKTLKISGTLGAMLGIAIFMNPILETQMAPTRDELFNPPVNNWIAVSKEKCEPVDLAIEKIKMKGSNEIKFGSAIFKDKALSLSPKNDDEYQVKPNEQSPFILGYLKNSNFSKINLFNKLQVEKDFKITGRLNVNSEKRIERFRLKLKTNRFNDDNTCDYTLTDDEGTLNYNGSLKRNQGEVIKHNGAHYLVALFEADFSGHDPGSLYVNFLIIEISTKME